MTLKEKLQGEVKEALKSGNSQKRTLLGMVLSAVKNREFDKRAKISKTTGETDAVKLDEAAKLNDEEVLETIASEIKKRKDSVEQFENGGRPELAASEKEEINMLMVYMPEQMSEEEVRAEVKKAIVETGAAGPKDMGKVIGAVMAKIKGKADGTLVSKLVKEGLM
jgi:uncharacterized protein YqeY